ncbi:MAG: hypothetical protein H6581_15925 [Bacteroidia bacterium]|nr:hypothetical protein [Bacteroidia bacterium]
MKRYSFQNLFFAFAAALLLTWTGCCPDCDDPSEIPVDSDPQITLMSPSEAYTLAYRGQSVDITFRLDDNEQLAAFWVEETWTSVYGTPYNIIGQTWYGPQAISGRTFPKQITYTVPTTLIQDYTTITLTAYVQDNKTKVAATSFKINVLPDSASGSTAYEITDYAADPDTKDADTIFTVLKGSKYYFSFITRSNNPTAAGNRDIGEVSINPTFSGMLNTPNQPGKDSTLVVTNASKFNYDLATYETIWQAYVTSNQIGDQTSGLKAGDIVIVKMVTKPHFAVMRILEKNNTGGFLKFEYKYTHN